MEMQELKDEIVRLKLEIDKHEKRISDEKFAKYRMTDMPLIELYESFGLEMNDYHLIVAYLGEHTIEGCRKFKTDEGCCAYLRNLIECAKNAYVRSWMCLNSKTSDDGNYIGYYLNGLIQHCPTDFIPKLSMKVEYCTWEKKKYDDSSSSSSSDDDDDTSGRRDYLYLHESHPDGMIEKMHPNVNTVAEHIKLIRDCYWIKMNTGLEYYAWIIKKD